jgi:ribonuclease D
LEDPNIRKFGRGINGVEKVRLLAGYGVNLSRCVDIGHLAKAAGLATRKNRSLSWLHANLVGSAKMAFPKNDDTRKSRWGKKGKLTAKQIKYAANDVYASVAIYDAIREAMTKKANADRPRADGNSKVQCVCV